MGPTRTSSIDRGITADARVGSNRVTDFAAEIRDLCAIGDAECSITKTTNGEILLDGEPACSGNA